jgi:hypothetical protein
MPGLSAKDLIVWGWLRLLLGATQVGLSAAAVLALFAVGLEMETWVLVGAAMLATCASRILYGGNRGPRFKTTDR